MSGITRAEVLRDYGAALRNEEASAFVGAGLSRDAGYVDWKGLLKEFADDLKLDLEIETDLTVVAQYHLNRELEQSRLRLHNKLVEEFGKKVNPSRSHLALAKLPIDVIWTSNYDSLVEDSLRVVGKKPRIKKNASTLTERGQRGECTVYKLHGDLSHPETIVLTRDDYRNYVRKFPVFRDRMRSDLSERTFLFLGFSFTDPHLDLILNELRLAFGDGQQREHFVIMRREHRAGRGAKKYQYALNRQNLKIEDLLTFGIKTHLVDDFDEVHQILEDLERQYLRTQVFVSGAVDDFDPKGKAWIEDLASDLGSRLMAEGFKLVSGFGKGLGPFIVSGALEALYKDGASNIDRRLRLKPFPFAKTNKDLASKYRADLVAGAGFAIFIAGNKTDPVSGETVPSDGVREEFKLAVEAGLIPIPIGCTGSVAAELWQEVKDDWTRYFQHGAKRDFNVLNRSSAGVADVLDALVRLMRANQS
jgi:hypothetical protein